MTLIDLSQYYDPHEGQTEVHNSPASIKVLEIGRRWGKSRCGYGEAVKNFVEAREIEAPSSLIPPWHGWALSPTFPQSRQIWNEAMSLWPSALVHSVSQDERTIYLNGTDKRTYGILEFKSAHDPDCHDEETEVLTKSGWKFWRDVKESDELGTRSDRGYLEFQLPSKLIKQYYQGEMVRLKSRTTDALVTPNHRFFVKKPSGSRLINTVVKAKDLRSGMRIPKLLKWQGVYQNNGFVRTFTLPRVANTKGGRPIPIPMNTWLAFLGIFLAEGSTCKPLDGGYRVEVSQYSGCLLYTSPSPRD